MDATARKLSGVIRMRPIDADAVVNVICDMHIGGKDGVVNALPNTYGADIREIIEQIDSLPSLDAVEVVRCQDCEYYHPTYCEIWSRFGTIQTREKGYCYMGERKDG